MKARMMKPAVSAALFLAALLVLFSGFLPAAYAESGSGHSDDQQISSSGGDEAGACTDGDTPFSVSDEQFTSEGHENSDEEMESASAYGAKYSQKTSSKDASPVDDEAEQPLAQGWKTIDGATYYFNADGNPLKYSQHIDGHYYYFNGKGVMQRGWITWVADGTKSYFSSSGQAVSGWQVLDGKKYYFEDDGVCFKTLLYTQQVDGDYYYFNGAGAMMTGWVTWSADGKRSWFDADGHAVSGWQTISGKRYYFNDAEPFAKAAVYRQIIGNEIYYFNGLGVMQTGWVTWDSNGKKSWFDSDGKAVTGWQDIDGERYYFDNSYYAVKWTQEIEGKYYYFTDSCAMATGWVTWIADGRRTWFDDDGHAHDAGWGNIDGRKYFFEDTAPFAKAVVYTQQVDGEYYYFNGAGAMMTGWVTWSADGRRTFFDSEGKSVLGWQTIDGRKYFFEDTAPFAKAVVYTQQVDGEYYYFNGAGAMMTGWVTWSADGKRSWFDADGHAVSGWQTISGKRYYFEYLSPFPKTLLFLQVISGSKYYFDDAGVMQTGWIKWASDGKWSYFGSTGIMYTGVHTIDGVKYNFGSSGKVNNRMTSAQAKMLSKINGYSSKTKYLIAVNRSTHKVGVFTGSKGNWTLKYYWSCVTGAPGSPTIKGSFLTTGYKKTVLSTDSRAKSCTQITGGYFFHTILASESELGKSLSHGCVRLAKSNAKWIYNNIKGGTRVVIY